ncbi:MAG: DUF3795 domain-containing protein [Thermodesulfobacteriota bacterium]
MKDSYCGLCEHCQLGSLDFQEAVAKVKAYVERLPAHWQRQCLKETQNFSLQEFRRSLDWFLDRVDCPGCKDQGGLVHCAIRDCAVSRKIDRCYECPDHNSCSHLIFV